MIQCTPVFTRGKPWRVDRLLMVSAPAPDRIYESRRSRHAPTSRAVVEIGGYACVVPYVRNGNQRFLKTIYRSRVYQKKYLPGRE